MSDKFDRSINKQIFTLLSEKDSIELARQIANSLNKNDIIAFYGDLGTGKTFFCP